MSVPDPVPAIRIRGARPQPPQPRRRHPPQQARRPHGRQRLGEEFFGIRHDSRRRSNGGANIEGLSTFARRLLIDQLEPPDVDAIDGLPPTVAIDQRVGFGQPPQHGRDAHGNPGLPASAVRPRGLASLPEVRPAHPPADTGSDGPGRDGVGRRSGRVIVLATLVRGRKGAHAEAFSFDSAREGFLRVAPRLTAR